MDNKIPKKLLEIYKKFDGCKRCREKNNPLRHILGGGKFKSPQFLLLFINPTHLNISSHKGYQGKRRYPFIGVRHFYLLLAETGFMDKELVNEIYKEGWQPESEVKIEQSLVKNGVYMTNLVKCAQFHPKNPPLNIIQEDLPLLFEEINEVGPRYIITFGVLPFRVISGKSIRLTDVLDAIRDGNYPPFKSRDILGKKYDVLPCYFPIGRGNPKKAVEILTFLKREYSVS